MFAPKAGKQGTKGDKLIYEDNISTIAFYQKWCLVSTVVSVVAIVVPIFTWTLWDYFWCVFLIVCNFGAWYFMKYIGKPTLNPDGSLVHPGGDINCSGSLGDSMKDVVILTSIVQVLSSLLSSYFLLLWTLIPGRALYLLWVHVLQPFFMASGPAGVPGATNEDGGSEGKKGHRKQKIKYVASRR